MKGTLPNLVILGAMKCGTTSLHSYINNHLDINMSAVKELDFFIEQRNWDKGIDWYKNQFDDQFIINGESSQNYSKRHLFKGVYDKIEKYLPECKFIYVVRDPLDRIESHYYENQFSAEDARKGLNHVIDSNIDHNWVKTSSYSYQLEPYLERFPKENFLILTLEDIKRDLQGELNKIWSFLGVQEFEIVSDSIEVKNKSSEKKAASKLAYFYRSTGFQKISRLSPKSIKRIIKSSKLYKKSLETDINFEKLSLENEKKIVSYLQDDALVLRDTFQFDLAKWKRFSALMND